MAARQMERPRGVFAAALSPLKADFSLDRDALIRHYRWLLAQGCDVIVALGTTGEANSFSLEERLDLLDALGATELPPKLIVGCGCCAIPDSVRLSKKALEIGAAGVLLLPPFYYKGVSEDGLFAAFARTMEGIGDPRLRCYLYHFPAMTGLDISLGLIRRLIEAFPDTLIGLKNSSGDWDNISAMLEAFPGFDVFAGSEEFLLPDLRLGGPGCMSATVNLLAPQSAVLYAGWRHGDAQVRQEDLTKLRQAITKHPAIPAMKALLAERSGNPAWRNLRPPLQPLTACDEQGLRTALRDLGLDLAAAA